MTKVADPYSRLYWRLIDDAKFAEVYADDHHFALWARLLMAADMAWPASTALPFGTRKASLDKLVSVKLVDLLPGNRYRIHGLDRERGKRQQKAADAAASRWDERPPMPPDPDGSANGMQPHPSGSPKRMPSRDETRRDETEPRRDEPRRASEASGLVDLRALVGRSSPS